jgi:hypothetical protein
MVVRDEHDLEESYHREIPDNSDVDNEPDDASIADVPPADDSTTPDGPIVAPRRPRRSASRKGCLGPTDSPCGRMPCYVVPSVTEGGDVASWRRAYLYR